MSDKQPSFFLSRKFALVCLVVAAAYFILMEHWRHIVPLLPYVFLLMCPLMHLFMHGGHGGHKQEEGEHEGHGAACHHGHQGGEDAESAYRRGVEDGKRSRDG